MAYKFGNLLIMLCASILMFYGLAQALTIIIDIIANVAVFIYLKITDKKVLLAKCIDKRMKKLEKLCNNFYGYEIKVVLRKKNELDKFTPEQLKLIQSIVLGDDKDEKTDE